jgi:hypothetical protein
MIFHDPGESPGHDHFDLQGHRCQGRVWNPAIYSARGDCACSEYGGAYGVGVHYATKQMKVLMKVKSEL